MVGGRGTRLQPLTGNCPKPMLPILNKPCVEYSIDSLVRMGIEEIIMACGFKSEYVKFVLSTKPGIKIIYSQEDRPLGTGGAIKFVESILDDTFIMMNGDSVMDIDFASQVEEHFKNGAAVTISLSFTDSPYEGGIVKLDGRGNVVKFKEKPKPSEVFSNILNTGVYVVQRDVLKRIPRSMACDFLGEVLPALIEEGCVVHGYVDEKYWIDIGRPENYLRANMDAAARYFEGRNWSMHTKNSVVTGKSYIGKCSEINGCVLKSAIVLNHCILRNSVLENSMVSEGCILDGSVIENSILGRRCVIKRGCEVSNAVLADGMILDENTILKDYGLGEKLRCLKMRI